MAEDIKEAPPPETEVKAPPVKPGEKVGKWVDMSHWQQGDGGETWVKEGVFVPDPSVNYGPPPGQGWAPVVEPTTGVFSGWTNSADGSVRPYNDKGELLPLVQATMHESKGQYGYGSKGHQKFNRIFTYVVKGLLGLMAGYGAGGAAGLWGAGAAGAGEGAAAAGAVGAGEGAAVGGATAGGEAGLVASSPDVLSGVYGTAGEPIVNGSMLGGGGESAAGAATPEWMQWAKRGMQMKDQLGGVGQQQGSYGQQQPGTIEQYPMQQDPQIDERAIALRQATELRARIAMLRAKLQEGAQ